MDRNSSSFQFQNTADLKRNMKPDTLPPVADRSIIFPAELGRAENGGT